jgi:[ribosomal protein S5]-alanine N-acetyltransferase
MKLNSPLIGKDIFLRSLSLADANITYLGWLSDPVINSHLEVRFSPPKTTDDLVQFITVANASSHTLMVGICLQENGLHIGNIKLGPIDWNHQVGDIGFLIGDKEHWGKGYASKSIAMLAEYAFAYMGIAKLTAGCYSENEGSRRALLKAVFFEEGMRRSQWLVDGKRQDGILFGRSNPSGTVERQLINESNKSK